MSYAAHNAARLYQAGHKLTRQIAKAYGEGKPLTRWAKDEITASIYNRAGTTTGAVIDYIKTVITVEKESNDD